MKKVFVVEDDVDMAEIFTTYLGRIGYWVVEIHTGTEACSRLIDHQEIPDAILLDMHLPGVTGDEIYALMKNLGMANRVLVCSADVRLVNRYKATGAMALAKPVKLSQLADMMQSITGGK